MKRTAAIIVLVCIVAALIVFNVTTVRKTSRRVPPAKPPELNEAAVVIYGTVEPLGKPIAVQPRIPGIVARVHAAEGDTVAAGAPLCLLKRDVEQAEVEVARAQLAAARKEADLSLDEFLRSGPLAEEGSISESEFVRLTLRKELDELLVQLREREVGLAEARFAELEVRSPVDGIIYKCDLRSGEYFGIGDGSRLIVGSPALQIRCDVEVFWIDRIDFEADYAVHNAETGTFLGSAKYRSAADYLEFKRYRTEDPRELLSSRYQEVIMAFEPEGAAPPIFLPVMVRLQEPGRP